MLTRRTALMGAAVAALMMAAPTVAGAADDLKLPRQKVELVAPPFVHAHEQATKAGPKIVEFKLTIEEKEVVIDAAGTKFHAMTFGGSMPVGIRAITKTAKENGRSQALGNLTPNGSPMA